MNQSATHTEQQTHWHQWIIRWQQSGQNQAAFCEAHDLVYHQFTYWRRKLATETTALNPRSGFVAVQRTEENSSGLTLTLPNGIRIQGLTPHHLAWLPQLLERLP